MNTTLKSQTTCLSELRHRLAHPPIKSRLKNLLMRAAGRMAVGLDLALGSRAGSAVGILTYHRVAAHVPGLPEPLHNVSPDRFREHISGLLDRGFRVWPLGKVLAHRAEGLPIPPRTLVITFDDGYQTVYSEAWPVLQQFQVPATVFVNTAFLDAEDPFPFDDWGLAYQNQAPPDAYRPLTMAQCRELADSGLVELAAHTHTHEDFRGRPRAFQQDLQKSVDILQERFDLDAVTFAFPFGSPHLGFAGGALEEAARATGVRCALTTQCALVDPASDPFRWGRFNAFCWDTSTTLAAKLDGWYGWAPALRQSAARKLKAYRSSLTRAVQSVSPRAGGTSR